MGLEAGAATAGSFDGIHCELVDVHATKPDAVIWGHNYGIVVNRDCQRFYDEGQRHLFATFEMIALETWRDQGQRSVSHLSTVSHLSRADNVVIISTS